MMKKRTLGKNHGVWSGRVVSPLEFSHEIVNKETEEVIEKFYKLFIEVEIKNKRDELIDSSVLPVTVSSRNIKEVKPEVENVEEALVVGEILFIKGSWRAYDYKDQNTLRSKLEQTAYVKVLEVHDGFQVRTRNKFEFEGTLVKKLYEPERDENGNAKKDEKGRLIPKLDEDGKEIYTVRKNREGKVVNDFIVAINRPNGSDYIPCIAYGKLAKYIASNVEKTSEIEGSGYIRTRKFKDGRGNERVAYEAVVSYIKPSEDKIDNEKAEE